MVTDLLVETFNVLIELGFTFEMIVDVFNLTVILIVGSDD